MLEYRTISSSEELRRLAETLRPEPLLGLDTEAAGFHRYHDRVSLIQLSTRDRHFLLDPFEIDDFSGLAELVTDPERTVILHDADYDFRILDRDLDIQVRGLFDTQVAAAFLGVRSLGLGNILASHLDVHVPKKFQRADWAERPLSEEMKDYAVTDTAYLPALHDRLREQLVEAGRLEWAEEEFLEREKIRWSEPTDPEDAYLRMKGARDLPPRGLAILREVYAWREERAREKDRAPFRILGNQSLLGIAARAPADISALQSIGGVSGGVARREGDDLLAAVRRGLAVPEEELPSFPRGPRRERDPEVEERVERMRQVRGRAADALDLDPGFLISRAQLAEIARQKPDSREALAEVPGVRLWQVEALGDALLDALR